jgi:hypothetical protein
MRSDISRMSCRAFYWHSYQLFLLVTSSDFFHLFFFCMWTVLKVSFFQIRMNLMGPRSWYMFLAECFLGSGLSTNAVFFQDKTFTVCLVKDVPGPKTIPGSPGEHSHFDFLGSGSVNPIHCRATVWTETLEKSYPVPYLNDRYGMHSTCDAVFMYLLSIFCTKYMCFRMSGIIGEWQQMFARTRKWRSSQFPLSWKRSEHVWI